jgi:hypothetical protein
MEVVVLIERSGVPPFRFPVNVGDQSELAPATQHALEQYHHHHPDQTLTDGSVTIRFVRA